MNTVCRVRHPGLLKSIRIVESDLGIWIDRGYATHIVARYLELRAQESLSKEGLLARLVEEVEQDQRCPGPYRVLIETYFD